MYNVECMNQQYCCTYIVWWVLSKPSALYLWQKHAITYSEWSNSIVMKMACNNFMFRDLNSFSQRHYSVIIVIVLRARPNPTQTSIIIIIKVNFSACLKFLCPSVWLWIFIILFHHRCHTFTRLVHVTFS